MSRRIAALLVVGLVLGSLFAVPGIAAGAAPPAPQLSDAVAFTDSDGQFGSQGHVLVEIRFDRAVNNSSVQTSDISVTGQGDSTLPVKAVRGGAVANDSELLVDLGTASQQLTPSIVESVAVNASAHIDDANGNTYAGDEVEAVDVTQTTTTITESAANPDRTAFRGETVAVVGDQTNEGLYVHSLGGNDLVKRMTIPDDGQVYALNTTGLSFDQYAVVFDGDTAPDFATGDRKLELWNFTMALHVDENTNVDDATVTQSENVSGTVDTNAADQPLFVAVRDGEDTIRSTQTVTDGNGDATFDFAHIELDEADDHFTVVATHPSTGTVAFERIKISQVDHDAGFNTTGIVDHRGNVVDIPVLLSPTQGDKVAADYATVTIGGPDAGYRANVTVFDANNDHRVDLRWNTYAADGTGVGIGVAPTDEDEPEDTVTVDSASSAVGGGPTDVLDAGLYEISVRSGAHDAAQRANTTTAVLLTNRSTNAVQTWTAPVDREVPLETLDDLQAAMGDGNLTRTRTLASGDTAVLAIDASGLEGAIRPTPDADPTEAFASFVGDGATLTSVQTNSGPNQADTVLNLSDSSVTRVVADGENDTYYLVAQVDDLPVASDVDGDGNVGAGDPAASLADGDRFNTTFAIPETDGGLAQTDERASVHWRYETADATVNTTRVDGEDLASVRPSANQSIDGTTNVAPGTVLDVRVRDDDANVSVLQTAETHVTSDGTWAAEFDFSAVPNGTALTVTVRRGGDVLTTADGEVQSRGSVTFVGTTETTAAAREDDEATVQSTTRATTENAVTLQVEQVSTTPDPTPSSGSSPLPNRVVFLVGLGVLLAGLIAVRRR
ncbi:MAG: BGTF surface domain-containing protein [Halanaeroarchaeum sp.]